MPPTAIPTETHARVGLVRLNQAEALNALEGERMQAPAKPERKGK